MRTLFWICFVTIILLNIIPNNNLTALSSDDFNFRIDYMLHLIAYMSLSVLFMLWRIEIFLNKKYAYILLFLVLGVIFSFVTELVQKYIPGRTFNPIDFYYNVVGILSGGLIISAMMAFRRK